MKFGAECCLYDDHEYLDAVMFPISKYLDRVLFLINDKPWEGEPSDNSATVEKVTRMCRDNPNMKLILSHWDNETDQRNFGLDVLHRRGMDVAFIIDGDEIHAPSSFLGMMWYIREHPEFDAYHMEWDTYWTKRYYRIEPRESFRPVVAVKPVHFKFTENRKGITSVLRTESEIIVTRDMPYNGIMIPPAMTGCHHMSYAKGDASIKRKIETFSHARQISKDWYDRVWLKWKPGDTNLHPITPAEYQKAVPTSFREWPDQLKSFVKKDRMSGRKCTIVVLNWNSKDLLKRCLKAVRDGTKGGNYDMVIVDNGSTMDDSVAFLKALERRPLSRFCEVRVIYNSENRGFAPAVNQAMRTCAGDVCLLNVDAEPQPGWLAAMRSTMIDNPGAGVVGPLGNEVASGHQRAGYVDKDTSVDNLHGYCMLILKEVIDDIGYFDENYSVGSYEDNDYGMRAKMAGYDLYLSAKSMVRHKAHQVFLANGLDPYASECHNREIYVNKFHSILYRLSRINDFYKDNNLARSLKLIIK